MILSPAENCSSWQLFGTQDDVASFNFSLSSTPDGSHREERVMVKDMVRDALRGIDKASGLAASLESLLSTAGEIRTAPSRLRAVFACRSQNFYREFDLPAYGSVHYLNLGRTFHLAHLLRAIDSCRPYGVALIEHGKARAFVVRGTEIQELAERFPRRDLSLHVDDSRVGWSHHIAGNLEDHDRAYFKALVPELNKFLLEHSSNALVIGCREDLWGDLAPYLDGPGWTNEIIGRFDPPNFEVSLFAILQASKPFFEQYLRRRYNGPGSGD